MDTAVAPLQQKLAALTAAEKAPVRSLGSERRIITVLFCDMVGSTTLAEHLDPETWTTIMNRVFRLLTEPVDQYGGTVTRLMGDAILALFGAPESHEDDPERAVLAGLRILEKTRPFRSQFMAESGMSFDFRVGINTGLAVVGEVGSDEHLEYTAMGDAVNVAARMEQSAAPGTVQISEATYQLVANYFEVESLGPIGVKGREEPVASYKVIGRKARGRRKSDERQVRLVGRQGDLDRLHQIVERVRAGRGQIALLVGEAGLGKSRLISEIRSEWLTRQEQENDLERWTELSATSYSTGRPYGTFENQMRITAGIAPTDSSLVAREKLHQVLAADPEHEFLQSIYERLLGIHTEEQAALSGEAFMHALYESTLKALCEESKGHPSVFVFDDLQWVDPASLGLIEHLLQLVHELPILFLFAMRPESIVPVMQLRQRLQEMAADLYSEFNLNPLTGQDSVQLAEALMAGAVTPEVLRQLVLDRAEGNPFYIEELVQMLLDRGIAEPQQRSVQVEGGLKEDGEVPANLLSLVAARVDRLTREGRLTLQLAAVIGRSFYVRVLQQISEGQPVLENHLQQLEMAEMIRESRRLPEWEYTFRHALTQEAVYSTLLREQRRRIHGAVGQALERLFPDRHLEFAPLLAHHFDEAQQSDKARHYYVAAGKEAAVLHANEQALIYFRRALAVTQEQEAGAELIIDLYQRLGRVLEHLHHFEEANRCYSELEQLGLDRGEKTMVLAALTSHIILYANPTPLFNPDKVETLAIRALDLADEIGDRATETKLYMQLCTLYSFLGQIDKALDYGERVISQARALGDHLLLAHVLNDISSHFYTSMGNFKPAILALSEATQLWRELGDKAMETDSLSTLVEINIYTGQFDEALTLAEQAREISRTIRNLWGESHSQFMLNYIYWERGQPDKAIAVMELSIHLGEMAGFIIPQIVTRSELALLYARLGNFKEALELIDLALDLAEKIGIFLKSYCMGMQAQIYLINGDLDAAETVLESIDEGLIDIPKWVFHIPIFQARVGFIRGRGRDGEALEIVDKLVDFVRKIGSKPFLMQALLQKATLLQGLNQPQEALANLEEAQTLGDALGAVWTMWQIEAEMGRLARNTTEAQDHFRQAQTLIQVISENTPDHFRDSFLGRPDIQAVMAAGDQS